MSVFIGIDPGMSGGIGVIEIYADMTTSFATAFKNLTEKDIWTEFTQLEKWKESHSQIHAVLENVHSMPKQGVASSFKFGSSFGLLKGLLYASNIPFDLVTSQTWQKSLGCLTGGDKNISKAMAQRLFPHLKITHAIADALLLAEYCRRMVNQRNGENAA